MFSLSRMFYNPDLSWSSNTAIFWAWESIVHHLYFIVLFVQRQFSETWQSGELWRLNMEKECAFFSQLFGGNATLCAESTMTLFSGIWFDTPTPNAAQKNWVGRLVTNYQHTEATIHFLICIFGFLLIIALARETKDRGATSVSSFVRWAFFLSLFFETWTMCVPYLFLFGWAWNGVTPDPRNPIVDTISAMGADPYVDGVQMGASLITMFWVSVVVLILDAWAMFRAWQFAMDNKDTVIINFLFFGVTSAAIGWYVNEFFTSGRGIEGKSNFASASLDALHGLFGNDSMSITEVAVGKN